MSKQIIKVTKKGVVESISGDSQEIPSSAEFIVDTDSSINITGGFRVGTAAEIATTTTGTITNENHYVFGEGPCQATLPENPQAGQVHKIAVFGSDPMYVSSSNTLISLAGGGAATVDSFSGSSTYREYYYDANTPIWVALVPSKY